MAEMVLETIKDGDFGSLTRKKVTNYGFADGKPFVESSYELWEGTGRTRCGHAFELVLSVDPAEAGEKMRTAYRGLMEDFPSVKLKIAAETVDHAQYWAESADLDFDLDASSFADLLHPASLSIERHETFTLVLGEKAGIFDGQAIMATVDAELNVSDTHIAG